MKKHYFLLASLSLGLMVASCQQNSFEEVENKNYSDRTAASSRALSKDTSNSNFFNVTPGMKEWASFNTNVEKLNACQLSDDVVNNLSTEELVEACLDYPFAYSYSVGGTEKKLIQFYIDRFNGLTELSNREDKMVALMNAYKNVPCSKTGTIEGRSYNVSTSFTLGYLELIMANPSFIFGIAQADLTDLKEIVQDRYMFKLEHPEIFGLLSIERSLMLCAVIVMLEGKPFGNDDMSLLKEFIENYENFEEDSLEQISKLIMS